MTQYKQRLLVLLGRQDQLTAELVQLDQTYAAGQVRHAELDRRLAVPRHERLLLTPHGQDGIRSLDQLAAQGHSGKGGRGISTLNARGLGVEVEDHIGVPVSINIL